MDLGRFLNIKVVIDKEIVLERSYYLVGLF